MMQMNGGVQSLDEFDRFEVLMTAVLVGDPLAVAAVVVEVLLELTFPIRI